MPCWWGYTETVLPRPPRLHRISTPHPLQSEYPPATQQERTHARSAIPSRSIWRSFSAIASDLNSLGNFDLPQPLERLTRVCCTCDDEKADIISCCLRDL